MDESAEPQNSPQPSEPAGQPAQPAGEQPPHDPSPFARPNMDLVNKGEDPSKWERR
jgi:hypothetical protein